MHTPDTGANFVLMGWLVGHVTWVVNRMQVEASGHTPGNIFTSEIVPFSETCMFRGRSIDGNI